jgi:hypothetical protein
MRGGIHWAAIGDHNQDFSAGRLLPKSTAGPGNGLTIDTLTKEIMPAQRSDSTPASLPADGRGLENDMQGFVESTGILWFARSCPVAPSAAATPTVCRKTKNLALAARTLDRS